MRIQKVITLSELPLSGKTRAEYRTIDRMTNSTTSKRKRGMLQSEGSAATKKKARVSFEELQLSLEAYLSHYNIKKSGNKPELIKRIEEHMFTVE